MSSLGVVQYIGDVIIHQVEYFDLCGDIMSTFGGFGYKGGYRENTGKFQYI